MNKVTFFLLIIYSVLDHLCAYYLDIATSDEVYVVRKNAHGCLHHIILDEFY